MNIYIYKYIYTPKYEFSFFYLELLTGEFERKLRIEAWDGYQPNSPCKSKVAAFRSGDFLSLDLYGLAKALTFF